MSSSAGNRGRAIIQIVALPYLGALHGPSPGSIAARFLRPAPGTDPKRLAVIVDERDHGLNRRSSSAWAK